MNRSAGLKLLAAAAVLVSSIAFAELPAPTPDELKKVIDYYYTGKDKGPILVELKACIKIDTAKDSATKNECIEPVSGPVKKGANVHAWTMWFVPDQGTYEDVVIQYAHEGQVRSTMDIKLSTSLRSRTYRASPLTKPGKWDVKVLRGTTELGSVSVTVE